MCSKISKQRTLRGCVNNSNILLTCGEVVLFRRLRFLRILLLFVEIRAFFKCPLLEVLWYFLISLCCHFILCNGHLFSCGYRIETVLHSDRILVMEDGL